MRLDLVLGEPTPKRMLLRFAFVMGVLLLVAQVGVLLRLNIENATILILLACVPAIALVSTEELLEASVNRERRRQSEQAAQAAAQTAMETRHTELMNAIENLTELIPKQGEAFVPTELEQGELPGDFPEVEPEAVLEQMRKARLGARYALIRANLLQRTRARMDARIWKLIKSGLSDEDIAKALNIRIPYVVWMRNRTFTGIEEKAPEPFTESAGEEK